MTPLIILGSLAALALLGLALVAWRATTSAAERSERDGKLIAKLCDTVVLTNQADLQIRRVELGTVGEGLEKHATAIREATRRPSMNGWHEPIESDESRPIPSHGEIP